MADIHRIGLDEVARHFEVLEDPRSTVNRQHPLVSVVVIALRAVLAGADGPTAIAKWAALKEEFLVEVLDLPNGIPRKDVFRRVLVLLEANRVSSLFCELAAVVACDGCGGDRRGAIIQAQPATQPSTPGPSSSVRHCPAPGRRV